MSWVHPGAHRFTDSELLEFNRISDENMVEFYREELEKGLFKEITTGPKKQLKRHGILTRKGHSSKSGFRLTEKGLKLLEEV